MPQLEIAKKGNIDLPPKNRSKRQVVKEEKTRYLKTREKHARWRRRHSVPCFVDLLPLNEKWSAAESLTVKERHSIQSALKTLQESK